MGKTNVITLRVPSELKQRLKKEAKLQGVSLNQLSNYLINEQLTQLELISSLELRLEKKSIDKLKHNARDILKKIPNKKTPDWDRVE